MQTLDPSQHPARRGPWWQYVGRLIIVVLILALGWYCVQGLSSLLHSPQSSDVPIAEREDTQPPLPVAPPDGPWHFAGQPWRVQVSYSDKENLITRLHQPPAEKPLPPVTDGERSLLSLLREIRCPLRRQNAFTVYEVQRPSLHAVVFTREVGGRERVILGRVAVTDLSNHWSVYEITPEGGSGDRAEQTESALLPLPAGSRILASRQDTAGKVIGELVLSSAGPEVLEEKWQRQGWTSLRGTGGPMCLQRGEQMVQVWPSTDALVKGQHVIFLTRVEPANRSTPHSKVNP